MCVLRSAAGGKTAGKRPCQRGVAVQAAGDGVRLRQIARAERHAVLFPRKINGMYTMLSRPSDSGHTPFGDIFLSQSPDMEFWGRHRHVMSKSDRWWEGVKIGGGAAPIETSEGWLLFYHGVTSTCNGFPQQIKEHRQYSPIFHEGDCYRLASYRENHSYDAVMAVSKDKSIAVVDFVQVRSRAYRRSLRLPLTGLEETALYREKATGAVRSGGAWMYGGLLLKDRQADFYSELRVLERVRS